MPQSKSISQRDAIALAKQGEPDLIATFLNYKLQPQGVEARVTKKQQHLLVLLEGQENSPDQQSMLNLFKQIASKLDPTQVEKIRVSGRQKGEDIPSWLQVIQVRDNIKPEGQLKGWLDSVKITPSLFSDSDQETDPKGKQGQRFLRFHLGLEDTALLPVNTVKEVLSVSGEKILAVPDTPASVLGIHNWRGEMLWLVDLNYMLGFSPLWEIENIATNINIIVLQVENQEIGIAVRQVETIEEHNWQKLQPPEGLFPDHILSYVQGYLTQASSIILDAQSLVKAFSS
ncbi:purine-binding chemotaxis protein CheW [Euhalothece natronophila Z-M001]|uniref:Purine-binding chemotaxis protein CheW n=1 Tax=Euhalothece natronophila Z-M001 TaxID=522448 RepID=A0A5B8NT57_9CHRO|nr:chemotaxis protein CheW [Euhalothece natronophila]QDZ41220.1 purine-binding chemotaxis protein CheW [Euhalothece natronophila Z-M001]